MSVTREDILQKYIEEIELTSDQATVFCCLVQLIPTETLAATFVHSDINKGMTIRAAARKWGIKPTRVFLISHRMPAD